MTHLAAYKKATFTHLSIAKALRWVIALLTFSMLLPMQAQSSQPVQAVDVYNFAARYPAGSIQSIDAADRALADAGQARNVILAQFADNERVCYSKFFASSCLENAKELRRAGLAQLRPVEVEAGRFIRGARAIERDKELEAKRLREELEAPRRLIEQQDNERAAAKKLESQSTKQANSKTEAQEQESGKLAESESAKRLAKQKMKMQRANAERVAKEKKRADNIAAFDKKQEDAKARQAKIAAKHLEKDEKAKRLNESAPSTP